MKCKTMQLNTNTQYFLTSVSPTNGFPASTVKRMYFRPKMIIEINSSAFSNCLFHTEPPLEHMFHMSVLSSIEFC